MAREAYRTLYGDLTKLKDNSLLADPAAGTGSDDELWELLAAISDWIDRYCDRHFYPRVATLYFDLKQADQELQVPDLISVTSLKDDENQDATFETTWASTDYQLLPWNADPTQHWGHPYTRLRASQLSGGNHQEGFPPGQKAVEIAGVWGYRAHYELAIPAVGGGLDGNQSDEESSIEVTVGTQFRTGQTILIDSEQMLITSINTNTLTVTRALNGTTGAAHLDGADISILRPPAAVERAALITAARIWSRAPAFEPFYVDADVDTDVRLLLEPYRRMPA